MLTDSSTFDLGHPLPAERRLSYTDSYTQKKVDGRKKQHLAQE